MDNSSFQSVREDARESLDEADAAATQSPAAHAEPGPGKNAVKEMGGEAEESYLDFWFRRFGDTPGGMA